MRHCTEPTAGGPCMLPLDANGRCSIRGHNGRFLAADELTRPMWSRRDDEAILIEIVKKSL